MALSTENMTAMDLLDRTASTGGAIHVDYGYLDRAIKDQSEKLTETSAANDELPATLYTRQLYLPIMITVYQNLEPLHWDVLYLRDNMSVTETMVKEAQEKIAGQTIRQIESAEQPVEQLLVITQQANDKDDKNPYCLLTLDVRNTWTTPFDIEFTVDNSSDKDDTSGNSLLKSVVTIQPALTKRYI